MYTMYFKIDNRECSNKYLLMPKIKPSDLLIRQSFHMVEWELLLLLWNLNSFSSQEDWVKIIKFYAMLSGTTLWKTYGGVCPEWIRQDIYIQAAHLERHCMFWEVEIIDVGQLTLSRNLPTLTNQHQLLPPNGSRFNPINLSCLDIILFFAPGMSER